MVPEFKDQVWRWRVAQNVCRSLPGSAYVDLQLDHMRVWSGGEKVEDAANLDYIPSIVAIYADLSRQVGQAMQSPAVAFIQSEQLSVPLTGAEK